jgi:hypothetical protein
MTRWRIGAGVKPPIVVIMVRHRASSLPRRRGRKVPLAFATDLRGVPAGASHIALDLRFRDPSGPREG